MKRPPSLRQNDRAVIVSPAGKIDGNVVRNAVTVLESWGLRTEIGENALGCAGRFSGSVEQRLSDLQKAFDDPDVNLILCARGGYGTVHLLEKLRFSEIMKKPKWVVGFSDITLLHAALQACGIASVHGPMAKHFSDEGADDAAVRFTKDILTGQPIHYRLPTGDYHRLNRTGRTEGRMFGGNLSLFCSLLGTRYAMIPPGGILFIEDTDEAPYRVDRMIHQLKLSGVFGKIGGLMVGRFTGYEEDGLMYSSLQESIREAVHEFDFPLCFNFPTGHVKENFPLIMGERAVLTIDETIISFVQ